MVEHEHKLVKLRCFLVFRSISSWFMVVKLTGDDFAMFVKDSVKDNVLNMKIFIVEICKKTYVLLR